MKSTWTESIEESYQQVILLTTKEGNHEEVVDLLNEFGEYLEAKPGGKDPAPPITVQFPLEEQRR